MAIEGVDYAWDSPDPVKLAAAGKKFACRYGGPGSDGKQLHAGELARLRAAGIDVVANAEGTANGLRGTAAGKNWAQSALEHFNALGMPAGRPIYFSADWDAGSADWDDIDAALRGAASVIGAARVGVYGSYDTINHCRTAGTARWFWQTYAWSGGRGPASYTHLYQYRNGVSLAGATLDLTRALLADYGQWGITEERNVMATLDADDKKWMLDNFGPKAVWAYNLTDPYDVPAKQGDPQRQVSAGSWLRYSPSRNLVDPRLSQAAGLAKAFNDFLAEPEIDVQELAAALGPLLPSAAEVSTEEIRQAIAAALPAALVAALREIVGPQA